MKKGRLNRLFFNVTSGWTTAAGTEREYRGGVLSRFSAVLQKILKIRQIALVFFMKKI